MAIAQWGFECDEECVFGVLYGAAVYAKFPDSGHIMIIGQPGAITPLSYLLYIFHTPEQI
jgi:hypothetical protein